MKIFSNLFSILNRFIYQSKESPVSFSKREQWVENGVEIGENTRFYGNVLLGRDGKDPITIGNNCVLTGCTILGHDAAANHFLNLNRSITIPVVVEDDCFIGFQAIILMGVTIGKGSIVGAGAVVTNDVPPGSVVAGNPAKVICTVEDLVARRRKLAVEHPEYFSDLPSQP